MIYKKGDKVKIVKSLFYGGRIGTVEKYNGGDLVIVRLEEGDRFGFNLDEVVLLEAVAPTPEEHDWTAAQQETPVEWINKQGKTAAGLKHDDNKPNLSLLSPIALVKIAQVMDFGAKKYEAHNWRKGFKWTRISAAALRHLFAWLGGEDKDPESGLSHLAHCACCILFLLEFETTKPELDDRYKT